MENKSSTGIILGVVAVAIIAGAAFGAALSPKTISVAAADQSVGGERSGLQEFLTGIKNGDLSEKLVSKKLDPSLNSVVLYKNTSGHDLIADQGSITVLSGDTASSTSLGSVFATTSTSILATQDFGGSLAEGKRALIQNMPIATTTTATTTSSVIAAIQAKGNGSVLIPNGSTLFGYLQQNTTGCNGVAGVCETATSTNRGFNPVFSARIRSVTPTQTSL